MFGVIFSHLKEKKYSIFKFKVLVLRVPTKTVRWSKITFSDFAAYQGNPISQIHVVIITVTYTFIFISNNFHQIAKKKRDHFVNA